MSNVIQYIIVGIVLVLCGWWCVRRILQKPKNKNLPVQCQGCALSEKCSKKAIPHNSDGGLCDKN